MKNYDSEGAGRRPLRTKAAKDLLRHIDSHHGTLAFARRWLDDDGVKGALMGLRELVDADVIQACPPLVDIKGSYTAQFEHTLFLRPTCKGTSPGRSMADWSAGNEGHAHARQGPPPAAALGSRIPGRWLSLAALTHMLCCAASRLLLCACRHRGSHARRRLLIRTSQLQCFLQLVHRDLSLFLPIHATFTNSSLLVLGAVPLLVARLVPPVVSCS